MQLRVFSPGHVSECSLDGLASFSVGGDPSDQLSLPDLGLVPGHVTLTKTEDAWRMQCAGEVTAGKRPVKEAVLSGADTYVLSRQGKVAMAVFETGSVRRIRLSPAACPVSVGRAAGNTAVIGSPLLSRRHCLITSREGEYYIEDAGSSVGTFVKGVRVTGARRLENGVPVVVGDVTLRRNGSDLELHLPKGAECRIAAAPVGGAAGKPGSHKPPVAHGEDGKKYLVYQRSPRLKQTVKKVDVEIDAPPSLGGKPEINWLSTLLPVLITVGVAILVTVVFVNPMMMMFTLPMTVGGLIVTVTNYRKQTRKFQEQQETRLTKYTEHLDGAVSKIEKTQRRQLKAMVYTDPETERCFDVVKNMDRTLWDRRPVDEDFCAVRIGSGPVQSAAEIKIPKATISLEDDELRERPEKLRKTYARVNDAPITCSIRDSHVVGIVGQRRDAIPLLSNMLAQFAVHQSYTEAKLICVYDDMDESGLGWVRDLPHALDEERQTAFAASVKEEADGLFSAFADVLKGRRLELEADNSYGAPPQMLPYLLFVIAQPAFLSKDSPINEYLLRRKDLGAGMIMVVEDITQLPKECNTIIKIRDGAGEMFDKNDAAHRQRFVADKTNPGRFAPFGRRMRHILCQEPGKKGAIPKQVSFYEMQGIGEIGEWDLTESWSASDVTAGLSAPIGVREGGGLLWLDLLDKEGAHGPHGLVAGTTGSGKSEVMLSYLLSLALRYPPSEVSYMVIDFKGGGMVNQLEGLPHLIGSITNLDEGEITRSLASINAELVRRQRLFAAAKVEYIGEYIRLYKAGKLDTPLPHLIILVDEFAELKAAHPEFMGKLISASRIGRSLGVHLILATQKPAGQVSDDIWSNSRFQLCLRVASREDSNEVIKSPLAFNIKEPGRAYLRVGNNEVFELFQSGYSGVKLSDGSTQLDAVVGHIAAYCAAKDIPALPGIILPPLPSSLDMPAASGADRELVSVGLYDDPDSQYQGELLLDPFGKNTFILGSSLTGKTNLMQTVLRGVADAWSPEEVNVYILDFASMALKNFEGLRHVGGVVTRLEDEKLKNLLKLLHAEIDDRRKRFLELGVSSFAAYWEAGRRDKPRILLMIDDLTALRELYFMEDDPLLPLCQNGLAYGVSVIAADVQAAGLGYKYLANFANRVSLFCNDAGNYNYLFEHCTLRIPNIPGRCIVELEKKLYQAQIYRAFPGGKEIERAENIRAWVEETGRRYAGRAVPIPEIPAVLTEEALLGVCASRMGSTGRFVLGLDYETVSPQELDLRAGGVLGLAGADPSGPRSMVGWLVRAAGEVFPDAVAFYVCDSISRGMADLEDLPAVAAYAHLPARVPEVVAKLEQELARRYARLMAGEGELETEKLLVLVLAGTAAIDAVTADPAALTACQNLLGKYKFLKTFVILSECDNVPINYSSPELLKKLKEEQRLLFFGDLNDLKMLDVSYGFTKKFKKPLSRGDGYYISGSECRKLKVPSA